MRFGFKRQIWLILTQIRLNFRQIWVKILWPCIRKHFFKLLANAPQFNQTKPIPSFFTQFSVKLRFLPNQAYLIFASLKSPKSLSFLPTRLFLFALNSLDFFKTEPTQKLALSFTQHRVNLVEWKSLNLMLGQQILYGSFPEISKIYFECEMLTFPIISC